MRYQQSTFPFIVYGYIDTASHKVIWLRILTDNFHFKKIARWYFDDFFEKIIVVARLRIDRGCETGNITSKHTFLWSDRDRLEDHSGSVIFGKSTANEIKRCWRHLHDRFEKYLNFHNGGPYHFRNQSIDLDWFLYDRNHELLYIISYYNPLNKMHRRIIGYVSIPVLVREMYLFVTNWKRYRIRFQKELYPRSNYSKWQKHHKSWGSKTNILKMTLRTDALNW